MKIIVTIIAADLVTNSFYPPFILSYKSKQELGFQQVVGLLTRNIYVLCYSKSRSTSKPCQIQWTFIKEFSYMLFVGHFIGNFCQILEISDLRFN